MTVADTYMTIDDKPYRTRYLHADTVLPYPVDRVWPYTLNIGSWMTDHRLETVSGTLGEVGHFERVWPRGVGKDVPEPHYHYYGITNVIPFKHIALEVFPEKGGSYGDTHYPANFLSIDHILLSDLGDNTLVTFIAVEVHVKQSNPHDSEEATAVIERYFQNLKELVGGDK